MTKRHFYRCNDCLSIVATDSKIATKQVQYGVFEINAVCDACEGKLEYMGETTTFGTLRHVSGYVPPCDGRCTNASGPSCDCPCGGENHGSQRVVAIYTDSPIPRLLVPKQAREKAEQFRALCQEYRTKWNAVFGPLVAARKRGEWLEPSEFARMNKGIRHHSSFSHAKHLKSASRTKSVQKLIAELSA